MNIVFRCVDRYIRDELESNIPDLDAAFFVGFPPGAIFGADPLSREKLV
jgi:uncharacterized protein (DUF2164 family)